MAKLVDLSELAAQNSGVAKIALEAVQDLLLKLIPCSRAQVKRIWAQHAKEHASQRFSLPSSRLPAAAHAASALCSLTLFQLLSRRLKQAPNNRFLLVNQLIADIRRGFGLVLADQHRQAPVEPCN